MRLKLIHPVKGAPHVNATSVSVEFSLRSHVLAADFTVRNHPAPHVNEALARTGSQWGLWDWDVVELFISVGSGATYYEFQLSPLGQYFELEIFEPRKRFNKEFNSGFIHDVIRISATEWSAQMRIPLKNLGWDGRIESLRGNAFAILGEERTYWSTGLPEQEQPDFHLPQYFIPLFR